MRRRPDGFARCAGAAAMLVAFAAVVGAEQDGPYHLPPAQFVARVRTIALQPLRLPGGVAPPNHLRQEVEGQLVVALRAKGYAVVPSTVYETIWRPLSERVGGTYDPITGAKRQPQYDEARDETQRELARLHQVDAVLDPAIRIGRAPFDFNTFTYSTWGETLRWQGQKLGGYTDDAPQEVLGAYLTVVIRDATGSTLYQRTAPIEWTTVYVGRGYEKKPAAEICDEADRNQQAVTMALNPLIEAAKAN